MALTPEQLAKREQRARMHAQLLSTMQAGNYGREVMLGFQSQYQTNNPAAAPQPPAAAPSPAPATSEQKLSAEGQALADKTDSEFRDQSSQAVDTSESQAVSKPEATSDTEAKPEPDTPEADAPASDMVSPWDGSASMLNTDQGVDPFAEYFDELRPAYEDFANRNGMEFNASTPQELRDFHYSLPEGEQRNLFGGKPYDPEHPAKTQQDAAQFTADFTEKQILETRGLFGYKHPEAPTHRPVEPTKPAAASDDSSKTALELLPQPAASLPKHEPVPDVVGRVAPESSPRPQPPTAQPAGHDAPGQQPAAQDDAEPTDFAKAFLTANYGDVDPQEYLQQLYGVGDGSRPQHPYHALRGIPQGAPAPALPGDAPKQDRQAEQLNASADQIADKAGAMFDQLALLLDRFVGVINKFETRLRAIEATLYRSELG